MIINAAILSISITLFYSTNDVISVYSVEVPVPAGMETCEKMKKNLASSHWIVNVDEMDGMQYRFKGFCNKK